MLITQFAADPQVLVAIVCAIVGVVLVAIAIVWAIIGRREGKNNSYCFGKTPLRAQLTEGLRKSYFGTMRYLK